MILAVVATGISGFCLGLVVGGVLGGRFLRTSTTRTGQDPDPEEGTR